MNRILLLTSATVLLTGFVSPPKFSAADKESVIYAPGEQIAGKSYEDWNVAFFRWAFGIKKDRNPVTDKTGEFAGEGQAGPVWFLGGNFGGTTKRKLTVPAGKIIFSPVIYAFPNAATAKAMADRVADVEVTLDGKSVGDLSKHRVTPRPFDFIGPGPDAVHPVVAGKLNVSIDGYWFALKPLSPGDHVLRIKGRVKAPNVEDEFELDLTYQLKVEGNK